VGKENDEVMSHGQAPLGRLTQGEQRALASFLAGRLPAGQLHTELCRAREAAVAPQPSAPSAPVAPDPAPVVPAPALRAA
jgi:hypothetical protein